MIKYRQATDNDLEKLLDLIEAGFSVQSDPHNSQAGTRVEIGREHRVLFSYLYSTDHFSLGRVYLAEDRGELTAAVGFFPQDLFFGKIKIPVWAISPVVTHPDYRGFGAAGSCLTAALESLKQQGITAVFLWGLPQFYPRFGFVPLLPRYKTKLSKEQLKDLSLESHSLNGGSLRGAAAADAPLISALYNQGNHQYWLQPERSLFWWQQRLTEMDIEAAELKEVPFPKERNFLVWENRPGDLSGYFYYESISSQKRLVISEGASQDWESALVMIQSFIKKYLSPEWTLYIRGTPEHLLNAALYRLGGTHLNPAPLAGMVKIIDWAGFFNGFKPLIDERLKNWNTPFELPDLITSSNIIGWRWNPDTGIQFEFGKSGRRSTSLVDEAGLTRLLFGFYDTLDEFHRQNPLLQMVFPRKYPFIWDANYLY
jgi:predicted N-acetyltransferase YhbS